MDEGIATVVKVNTVNCYSGRYPPFSTEERLKEELYYTTAIEVDIR